MKVHWTETAERHLEATYAFIAQILAHMRLAQLIKSQENHNR